MIDTWELAIDTWELAIDTWELVNDTWELVNDTWKLMNDTWELMIDTWELTIDTWELVNDFNQLTSRTLRVERSQSPIGGDSSQELLNLSMKHRLCHHPSPLPRERGQEFWLPSPQGEGLARALPHFVRWAFHIYQRLNSLAFHPQAVGTA